MCDLRFCCFVFGCWWWDAVGIVVAFYRVRMCIIDAAGLQVGTWLPVNPN